VVEGEEGGGIRENALAWPIVREATTHASIMADGARFARKPGSSLRLRCCCSVVDERFMGYTCEIDPRS
jgi:hypothetical protein